MHKRFERRIDQGPRRWVNIAAHGVSESIGLRVVDSRTMAVVEEEEEEEDETATRSHEGHIVRVVGGFMCIYS